jgi:hypothetical protein
MNERSAHRPELSHTLSADTFRRWYWLKSELLAFCRQQGLPASGGKEALAQRIASHLEAVPVHGPAVVGVKRAVMPDHFFATTIIGSGWRYTQALRSYFESVHGPSFRFNEALRMFIAQGEGRTLAEASDHYRNSLLQVKRPIPRQFEYNRHMRAFYEANPGASREQALESWWARRAKPQA